MTEKIDNFEGDYCEEENEEEYVRTCDTRCAHYDSLNCCCWQATKKGLCFHVDDGDECHLGYSDKDGY